MRCLYLFLLCAFLWPLHGSCQNTFGKHLEASPEEASLLYTPNMKHYFFADYKVHISLPANWVVNDINPNYVKENDFVLGCDCSDDMYYECVTLGGQMRKLRDAELASVKNIYKCFSSDKSDRNSLCHRYKDSVGKYQSYSFEYNVAHGVLKYNSTHCVFIFIHDQDVFELLFTCQTISASKYTPQFIAIANTVFFDN